MQIHTELEINSPADEVWKVLVDFPRYSEWNPVITAIDGAPYVGEKISFKLRAAPGIEIPIIACEILVANAAERELRWRGPAIPFLDQVIAGEHYFIVQSAGESKSRFVHGENFTGFLADVLKPILEQRLVESYNEMNRALRARCEGRSR